MNVVSHIPTLCSLVLAQISIKVLKSSWWMNPWSQQDSSNALWAALLTYVQTLLSDKIWWWLQNSAKGAKALTFWFETQNMASLYKPELLPYQNTDLGYFNWIGNTLSLSPGWSTKINTWLYMSLQTIGIVSLDSMQNAVWGIHMGCIGQALTLFHCIMSLKNWYCGLKSGKSEVKFSERHDPLSAFKLFK